MQTDTYKTILKEGEGLYKEKGSKFIAFSHHVITPEEAKEIVDGYKKTYYDARHVCYAYNLRFSGGCFRANDDGEPSGTAGRPALAVLQGSGLGDIAVVVTRYFGGTKLGTGGLVRAYTDAVKAILQILPLAEKVPTHTVRLVISYPLYEQAKMIIHECGGQILEEEFGVEVTISIQLLVEKYDLLNARIIELSRGKIAAEIIDTNLDTIMKINSKL